MCGSENLIPLILDQQRKGIKKDWNVKDALTDGAGDLVSIGDETMHVIGYMKNFLFHPSQMRTPVTVLSGGEQARLFLARGLRQPSNLLVMDEPTNDLDLETLDLLQEMIAAYDGTVILVSHDRDFLDRTVTAVFNAEGAGQWVEYAGGYSDMKAQQKNPGALASKADENKPHRHRMARGPKKRPPRRASCLISMAIGWKNYRRKWPIWKRLSARLRQHWPRMIYSPATPINSKPMRRGLKRRKPSWPHWKKNGCIWKCCARKSKHRNSHICNVQIGHKKVK